MGRKIPKFPQTLTQGGSLKKVFNVYLGKHNYSEREKALKTDKISLLPSEGVKKGVILDVVLHLLLQNSLLPV